MVCPPKLRKTKAPKTCGLVSQFPNSVQHEVNDLLASGVVPVGTVTSNVSLACNELLRVDKLVVSTIVNFMDDCSFHVYQHCPGHMLASTCLTEGGVEGVTSPTPQQRSYHLACGHRGGC